AEDVTLAGAATLPCAIDARSDIAHVDKAVAATEVNRQSATPIAPAHQTELTGCKIIGPDHAARIDHDNLERRAITNKCQFLRRSLRRNVRHAERSEVPLGLLIQPLRSVGAADCADGGTMHHPAYAGRSSSSKHIRRTADIGVAKSLPVITEIDRAGKM